MSQDVIHPLPIDAIRCRPQVRREFNEAGLAELAQSVKESGLQQPIRVRRDGEQFVIIFGERRWRAAMLAGLKTIPAIVVDYAMSDAEILQVQLIENLQRADLSPLEQAEAIYRLMQTTGCTAGEAARKVGKSPSMVSKLLALRDGPDALKAQIASGEIGVKAGYELLRNGEPSQPERNQRRQRLTAILDRERRVVTEGVGSLMEDYVQAIEMLLIKIRAARKQGIELPTFLAMLRDQAGQ